MVLYTVRRAALLDYATAIERDANAALNAWIVLGQSDRYGAAMSAARSLRRAADAASTWERREILRNSGFDVRTPRAAAR